VPLHPLTPKVTKHELGTLRLWQDDLAEIVRLVQQLPDVQVVIEADNNTLDDVHTDLPKLGQRVSYFTVTATTATANDGAGRELVSVKLAKERCRIEATEPDLTTTGLIEALRSLLGSCRRMPPRLQEIYRTPTSSGAQSPPTISAGFLLFVLAAVFCVIFAIGAVEHLVHMHGRPWTPWPQSIIVAATLLVVAAVLSIGLTRSRTLLFTATRAEAPQTGGHRDPPSSRDGFLLAGSARRAPLKS
jgi:hypothetical protein